jgi:hypothetical protein
MSAKQSAKLRVRTVPLVEDPFVNHSITDMPCWWKYGVQVLVGITLFPIRLALLLFVVAPFILICLIPFSSCFNSCCGNKKVANAEDEQPHGCCRACWVYPLRVLNRLLLWCFGFFWIAVAKKKGATPTCCNGKPAVIVANHTALMDAMFMNWFYAPMAVGKAEIKKIPVAGNAAMAFQAIFVNRKNPNSKKEVLESVFQFMCVRRQRSCGHGQIFFVDDVATFQFTSCHVDARVHPFHRGKEQCHFVCQQCTNCDGQRNECGDNRVSGRGFGVLVCVLCRVLFFPFSFTVCKCHSGLPRLPLTFWPLTCFFCCCCFAFLVLNQ